MSPLVILALLRSGAGRALGIWRGLPGPIKAVILICLAGVGGALWGEHRANARCEARIEASIKAARDRDEEIARNAKVNADRQRIEADARTATIETEVKGYVEDLAKRTAAACGVGDDAARFNDGLGVQDDPVQPARPKPAAGRGHRAQPGAVPEGKGKR